MVKFENKQMMKAIVMDHDWTFRMKLTFHFQCFHGAFSVKQGRKCTVPSESPTHDLLACKSKHYNRANTGSLNY